MNYLQVTMERMLFSRELALFYFSDIFTDGGCYRPVQVGIFFDEFWTEVPVHPKQVVDDQHLPVASGTGANTDGWNVHKAGDLKRHFGDDSLQK